MHFPPTISKAWERRDDVLPSCSYIWSDWTESQSLFRHHAIMSPYRYLMPLSSSGRGQFFGEKTLKGFLMVSSVANGRAFVGSNVLTSDFNYESHQSALDEHQDPDIIIRSSVRWRRGKPCSERISCLILQVRRSVSGTMAPRFPGSDSRP